MICCFSPPCGLGAWAGLVWPALLLCVTSVGVTPLVFPAGVWAGLDRTAEFQLSSLGP